MGVALRSAHTNQWLVTIVDVFPSLPDPSSSSSYFCRPFSSQVIMWTVFCFLFALGCALGGQGQKCCSSCKSIVDCGNCAREGNECKIASGFCAPHITDSNVDCSLKTANGEPCCVFSKQSSGCQCVQRRCHLHDFPSARVGVWMWDHLYCDHLSGGDFICEEKEKNEKEKE